VATLQEVSRNIMEGKAGSSEDMKKVIQTLLYECKKKEQDELDMIKCPDCDGSGKDKNGADCSTCGGTGEVEKKAEKSKKEDADTGIGSSDAPTLAAGAEPKPCPSCDGTGETSDGSVCPTCSGQGIVAESEGEPDTVPCTVCDGTGTAADGTPCTTCSGSGVTTKDKSPANKPSAIPAEESAIKSVLGRYAKPVKSYSFSKNAMTHLAQESLSHVVRTSRLYSRKPTLSRLKLRNESIRHASDMLGMVAAVHSTNRISEDNMSSYYCTMRESLGQLTTKYSTLADYMEIVPGSGEDTIPVEK